jgi:small subunit ribosomal protein S20
MLAAPLLYCTPADVLLLFLPMPITRSAKKALRVSNRKAAFNFKTKSTMKDAVKATKKFTSGKLEEVKASLSAAYKAIDKAAKKGVIKKNAASRKKSRLAKFLKKLG